MKKLLFLAFLTWSLSFVIAEEPNNVEFMRGYISSKLEDKYPNTPIEIHIENEEIIVLSPLDARENDELQHYLENFSFNYPIHLGKLENPIDLTPIPNNNSNLNIAETFEEGDFLPELNPFFPTMLAQRHILGYSVGYRSYDKVFHSSIPVSIGDQFSLYQFKLNSPARLYVGIEACVWAIFEAKPKSLSLINADYFVSVPLTYINDGFSARLRLFHQSSHLGDEFMLEHPKIVRVNPSMEGLELSLAYEFTSQFTLFLGYSRILRSDDSFKVKPNCVYYGFNYFLDFVKIRMFNVEGIPYIATFFKNNENNHWEFDRSAAIGYQWDKSYGRKLRIYVEGHNGYSNEGQFARKVSRYVSINLLYGY